MAELRVLHAEVAIPDASVLREHGIVSGVDEARLILVMASQLLAYGQSKARNALYQSMCLIHQAMACEVVRDDGVLPGVLPARTSSGVSQGVTAIRRAGVTHHEIMSVWERRPDMLMSCFPLAIMCEFLAPSAWPYFGAFIATGPADAGRRLREAVKSSVERGLKDRTIRSQSTAAWLLMRLLKEFAERFQAENDGRARRGEALLAVPPGLDAWTWRPPPITHVSVIKMGASTKKRDTSAVPLDKIRIGLRKRAAEAAWGRWEPEAWPLNKRWRALKRLVTLALLSSVSPRIDHLRMLDVDDFAWHRFEDGNEAWGLRMRGEIMKLRNAGDVYWIKLPPDLAAIIHAWIVCSGREIGQEGAPLLIARKVQPGQPGDRYVTDSSLSGFITGGEGGTGRIQAIIPFDDDDRWHGYQAHRFRSTVIQQVDGVMYVWRLQNVTHPLARVREGVFAELLVDHKDDDMGYRDHSYRVRREQIVALAAELHWNSIWGDGARRHGLDTEAIRSARERVEITEAAISALNHEIAELEVEKAATKRRKDELLKKSRDLKREAREDAIFELDALRDRIDDLSDQINDRFRRQLNLKDQLLVNRASFDAATHNEIILPDDLPDDAYEKELAAALGTTRLEPTQELELPLADELTQDDVAELLDAHRQTIWRWRTGRSKLPSPRPFDPEAWIEYDGKDFRLPVYALNLAAIAAPDPVAALVTTRRNRVALGFNKRKSKTTGTRQGLLAPSNGPAMKDADSGGVSFGDGLTPIDSQDNVRSAQETRRRGYSNGMTAELRELMRSAADQIWTMSDLYARVAPTYHGASIRQLQQSIHYVLHKLTESGELQRVGRGHYRVFQLKPS